MRYATLVTLALGATALVPLSALAQSQSSGSSQPNQSRSASQESQGVTRQPLSSPEFLKQAAISNEFDIQSSKLALDKSNNDEIRRFAKKLIDDRTSLSKALNQADDSDQGQVVLDQEYQTKLQRLRQASGRQFNTRYARMQWKGHRQAVSMFARYAAKGDDQQLRKIARQTLPEMRDELGRIRNIREDLFARNDQDNQQNSSQRDASRRETNRQQPRSSNQTDSSDRAANVVVRQTNPAVRVEQGQPNVRVRQAQPEVSVRQGRPQIVVHQPRPTITIDIPQPEITVRMPEPDVNVSMNKPQVTVDRSPPRIKVLQSDQQPDVKVENRQAEVNVEATQQNANVDIIPSQDKPSIDYRREEPRVVINKPKGNPAVHYETTGVGQRQEESQSSNQDSARQRTHAAQPQSSPGQQAAVAPEESEAGTPVSQQPAYRSVRVSQIVDMPIKNARGADLGDVDRVVADQTGQQRIVVANGGFLGIGEDLIAMPANWFSLKGGHLVLHGISDEQIDNMPDYRDLNGNYRELSDNVTVHIAK